ncbi:MAG: dTMP kinase [Deltaproteobacteria bacterium RIFCSPLOWO2_02_FULL_53_8]|nr:MAG: dTMP kinase [Deltaproteobacteria bacterium RIFCSPLOWO2_02_FULL_53_8]
MGLFITFEGIEGCGKTTQAALLDEHLRSKGVETLLMREPGGTALGEKVRGILLTSEGAGIDAIAELFLYEACRAQLVNDVIRPALAKGITVICDRFIDSTVAYQGFGRGIDIAAITSANTIATNGLSPDITLLIDCPPEAGIRRALSRLDADAGPREDRFEREALAFHTKVQGGYLKLAASNPDRIKVINGEREIPLIHKEICDIIKR